MIIVPAVIPQNAAHLTDTLRLFSSFSGEAQVDIVDGMFAHGMSWPYTEDDGISALSLWTTPLNIEVDLMIDTPERVLESYLKAGVARAVVHLESVRDLPSIIGLKRTYAFALGFSIGNNTPLEMLEAVIGYADYVQLMGIASIGTQGQPFDDRVIGRIHALLDAHASSLPISVDGSVNEETLPRLMEAGADRAIAGSAILNAPDPRAAYETLTQIATR